LKANLASDSVGTRDYSSVVIAVTILTTILGPADALGMAASGFQHGLVWVVFPLLAAVSLALFGRFVAAPIRVNHSSAVTLGDIIVSKYGKAERVILGLVVTVQCFAFSAIMVLAGAKVLELFAGVELLYGLIYTAGLTGIYTAAGGLPTLLRSDTFQLALVGVLFLFYVGFSIAVFMSLDPAQVQPVVQKDAFADAHSAKVVWSLFATYFLGELLLPLYAQRALVAKDGSAARNGFLIAGGVVAVWYVVIVFAGSVAGSMGGDPESREFVLMQMIDRQLPLDSGVRTVVVAVMVLGLVALIHSGFDTILNIGGFAFGRDVIGQPLGLSDDMQAWLARNFILVLAAGSTLVAYLVKEIIPLVLMGYSDLDYVRDGAFWGGPSAQRSEAVPARFHRQFCRWNSGVLLGQRSGLPGPGGNCRVLGQLPHLRAVARDIRYDESSVTSK
jgi:SSS family solute:Na+ symporter